MALTATDLTLARGGVPVITGLSFEVPAGQALILRGPNGAGKTTVLRAIAGLQRPIAGKIIGAQDYVAFAGHADGLKAMLSVAENLMFWARVFGQQEIDAALDGYALRPLRDRLAGTLSAGQKRRLGLARLLVTGCPLWVMDEPTVSLDTATVAQFADVVRAHLADGGSALIATHIDLGIEAEVLDISGYRAAPDTRVGASDEAFL